MKLGMAWSWNRCNYRCSLIGNRCHRCLVISLLRSITIGIWSMNRCLNNSRSDRCLNIALLRSIIMGIRSIRNRCRNNFRFKYFGFSCSTKYLHIIMLFFIGSRCNNARMYDSNIIENLSIERNGKCLRQNIAIDINQELFFLTGFLHLFKFFF